jgi:xanthine dehydrogenase small subunit
MIKCIVNDKQIETSLSSGAVALDIIREELKLTGTKEGCREGECGACTILLGELLDDGTMKYKACASCLLPVGEIRNKHVVTVEGLNLEKLNTVQQAIFDNNASQCGFCTPGIVLSLTGFLLSSRDFSYDEAVTALDGNICRCTGYVAIRNAARRLSDMFSCKGFTAGLRIEQLVESSVLPKYFLDIPSKLSGLQEDILIKSTVKTPVLIAGGTDLFVQKPDELIGCDLEFVSEHPELCKIEEISDAIAVGGGVTTEEFRTSAIINKYFPTMKDDLLLVSSTIMRNRATLAGNIVNASPIGDVTIILLALSAVLIINDHKKQRTVALDDFYNGYKNIDLKDGEFIENILIPLPAKNSSFNFEKVSNRKYLDIASCNSAISLEVNCSIVKEIRISAGGVTPIPSLLKKTSEFIKGKEISNKVLVEAGKILLEEIAPIDDIRGSAKYKKLLLKQLFFAHFIKKFPELVDLKEVAK